jgi:hypothetical protein
MGRQLDNRSSKTINWSFWVQLFTAATVGAFLLLLLFQRECIEFSGVLETILLTFGSLIQTFARVCAFLPNLVLYFLNFPPPESDVWQVAFALAIFHQGRTFPTEWAINERRWPAVRALIVCTLLGASVSYLFGILVSEPKPVFTSLFIALLYGFLEFVRYTLLSVEIRRGTSQRFYDDFRRRHLLYTVPYTLIGVFSALTSWAVFGASPALLPFFAVILFSFIGFYILVVEIVFQVRRARGSYHGVPFFESTRTQTVLVLVTSCGICLAFVYKDAPFDLLDFALNSCTMIVE